MDGKKGPLSTFRVCLPKKKKTRQLQHLSGLYNDFIGRFCLLPSSIVNMCWKLELIGNWIRSILGWRSD